MLVSMNWIREFVNLDGIDLDDLIHRFTLATAEVEDVYHYGQNTNNVVVAKILSVENHPNSKKLHLLKVDAGDKIYDCVCGAPNVYEGKIVAFAKEGGMVNGNPINRATVAGYESCGMCCSEAELGISDDHSGLMDIEDDVSLGTDIKDIYPIEDTVFDVDNKSLTNRPDLWGHYGIAREFSALSGRELKPYAKLDCSVYGDLEPVAVEVRDREHCYRYSALKVENITRHTSPTAMRIRLFYCGSRAINLLADLTNYIMLELGQPMHAFDLRKVDQIEVQRFENDFEFETLDEVKRHIDTNTLMICSHEKPVAIAGIMGGNDSAIADDTTSLLLESANFDGVSVRKSSTRLGLRTDASMRYEKTMDPEITVAAIERFMQILVTLDPNVKVISALTDVYAKKYDVITLEFNKKYVDRYTGIEISDDRILGTLRALGFKADRVDEMFKVTVPSWRATKDVTITADIIEEITRIYGYDNFEITTTLSPLYPVLKAVTKSDENQIKDMLVKKYNMHEIHSYIWNDQKKLDAMGIEAESNVRLTNAMAAELSVIRNSLIPTLLTAANENKSYAPDFGIFEVARVVEGLNDDGTCNERKKLGIVMMSHTKSEKEIYFELRNIIALIVNDIKHSKAAFAFADAKHSWEHPKNTVSVSVDGVVIGSMAAIHPVANEKIDKKAAIVFAEIDMPTFSDIKNKGIAYDEPSKYPSIEFDLSFVINDGIKFSDIEAAWKNDGFEYLKDVFLIDVYDDGTQKSISIRLHFMSKEKTLQRTEIQPYVDNIIKVLSERGINLKA